VESLGKGTIAQGHAGHQTTMLRSALCGQGGGAKHRRGAAKKTHPHKNPTDVPLFLSSSDAATDPPLGPDEIEAKGIRLAGAPVYLDMQVSGFFG
jgi:hypothetical protein